MNPFELADYAGFLLALLTGTGVGRAMKRKPKKLKPECSCGDGYGTHEENGPCRGQMKRASGWDSDGYEIRWEWVQCPCLRYDGPDPLVVEMMR